MGHEKYQISIERDGRMVPVGSISGESYRTATFSYIEEYLDDRNAVPVSISLPLQRDAAAELSEAGFSKAKEMEDRILRAGGYAKL